MAKLNYDDINAQLESWASICSSSEVHGLVAGLGSVGLAADMGLVINAVMKHIDEESSDESSREALIHIQGAVVEQYEDPEFGFELLLPDDEEELGYRIRALSDWCQGFLVGFGTGVKTKEQSFSEESQEVLKDLVEISQVGDEVEQGGSEEEEAAFFELEEYVRTAAMMLYSEFGVEQSSNEAPKEETYH